MLPKTLLATLVTLGAIISALPSAATVAPDAKREKWKSSFSMEREPLASNYSSTCRRQFGAGLYDAAAQKTFVCWNGPGMSIFVRAYDHATSTWGKQTLVCELNYTSRWQYHNYPVMTLAPDGRLVVYYCEHGDKLFQVKAPAPHSIDGTWSKTEISADKTTYPMPMVADGVIYVFYSRNDEPTWPYRSYRYIKSSDSGSTWTEPVTVIDSEKKDPLKFDEVYGFGVCYNPAEKRIGITWTMAGSKAHNAASRDLYFGFFNTRTGNMENAAGHDLGTSVLYNELASCRVIIAQGDPDAQDRRLRYPVTRPQPSYISKTGAPVIAFNTYKPKVGDLTCFMRWEGSSWKTASVLPGGTGFYDLEKLGDKEFRMLCRVDSKKSAVFHSGNGGASWKESAIMDIDFAPGFNRLPEMMFIENSRPPIIGFLGTGYVDGKKPGGYNYDGIFHTYIIKSK